MIKYFSVLGVMYHNLLNKNLKDDTVNSKLKQDCQKEI